MKRIVLATTLALTLIVSSLFPRCQTAVEAWAQRYSEAGAIENISRAISVAGSSNAFVTGFSTDSNAFKHCVTVAYSSSGAALWANRYHGLGDFYDA